MKEILLRTKRVTVVDDDDYAFLTRWKWNEENGYARRQTTIGGKSRVIYMHRLIMGLAHGNSLRVDHIDMDKLNNQRSNLLFGEFARAV